MHLQQEFLMNSFQLQLTPLTYAWLSWFNFRLSWGWGRALSSAGHWWQSLASQRWAKLNFWLASCILCYKNDLFHFVSLLSITNRHGMPLCPGNSCLSICQASKWFPLGSLGGMYHTKLCKIDSNYNCYKNMKLQIMSLAVKTPLHLSKQPAFLFP